MIPVPTSVRVWLATGYTDLRRGFPGLSLQIQEVLRRDPLSGQRMVRVSNLDHLERGFVRLTIRDIP